MSSPRPQITATSPAGSAGTVDITVTTASGTSATGSSDQFTYRAAPTVTGISPSSGTTLGGTSLTITGTNFVSGATVTVGGTAATGISVVSTTSITATTPAGTAGAQNVVVTNPDGQSGSLSGGFTYVTPAPSGGGGVSLPGPTVVSISPSSGTTAGGINVTITGANFMGGATVTIGGTAATGINVVSTTSITATTPVGTAGAQNVVVTNPDGQSSTLSGGFTYLAPAPTVTSISPNSGPIAGGTNVTIAGTNFVSGATVTIGGTAATGINVASSTAITATTPAGTAGVQNVVVTNPDNQSGTLTRWFYLPGACPYGYEYFAKLRDDSRRYQYNHYRDEFCERGNGDHRWHRRNRHQRCELDRDYGNHPGRHRRGSECGGHQPG